MDTQRHILQFILVALIVAIVGGFAGWYVFIRGEIRETERQDAGRGAGSSAPTGGFIGSTYQNIISGLSPATSSSSSGSSAPARRLWSVSPAPVAGFGFVEGTAEIFFAERATGNILRADPYTSTITRLTNTLMPKAIEAHFSRSGDVVLRFADEQSSRTYIGTVASSTSKSATSTPSSLEGVYLPLEIEGLALQPNAPRSRGVLFIVRNPSGGSFVAKTDWRGENATELFTSPLSQWRVQWRADGTSILTQKASENVPGTSLRIAPTGTTEIVESGVPGLAVTYHPTSAAYLYSASQYGLTDLFVRVPGKDTTMLSIKTVADKCVWAPGDGLIAYCAVPREVPGVGFIDAWYRGAVHSSDVWWKVQAREGIVEPLFESDEGTPLDVENPLIDEKGGYIGFINGIDKSLWLLRIAQ